MDFEGIVFLLFVAVLLSPVWFGLLYVYGSGIIRLVHWCISSKEREAVRWGRAVNDLTMPRWDD